MENGKAEKKARAEFSLFVMTSSFPFICSIIQIAQEKNADYVWLGVWEENPGATLHDKEK